MRTSIRIMLVKPVRPFDATHNGLPSNPDKTQRREAITEEIEATADATALKKGTGTSRPLFSAGFSLSVRSQSPFSTGAVGRSRPHFQWGMK